MKHDAIKIFEDTKVRAVWDGEKEKWYFSVIDAITILTESPNPQIYWRVLKKRIKNEGNETVTNCNGLKMLAPDGKMLMTDVADTAQLFRLIQFKRNFIFAFSGIDICQRVPTLEPVHCIPFLTKTIWDINLLQIKYP